MPRHQSLGYSYAAKSSMLRGRGFLGFLVSKFLGFKVYWFLGYKVSKFQRFNDPILPKHHVIFFDRYRSHIQDFQDFIRRIVGIFRRPPFRTFASFWISKKSRFANNIFQMFQGVFLILFRYPGVPKDK